MNSIVIYASHFGNTRKVGEAIADGLRSQGTVQMLQVDEAPSSLPVGTDLVCIGGPTEQHGMTPAMIGFLDRMAPGALKGIYVAAFDTRLCWPRWLSGSAAVDITEKMRLAGAQVIALPESFFIKGIMGTGGRDTAELEAGELVRATAWAKTIAGKLAQHAQAVSG